MILRYITILICCVFTLSLTAQIDRSKQPQPGPPPTINLDKPSTFVLNNGLKVLVVKDNKLPRVTARLILDNPPHAENDKAGIGSLTAAVLGNGTQNIAKDTYLEEIDYLGAFVSINAESAYASSLSKYFPRVLELMADGALNPLFSEEDFAAEKAKLIEGIKSGDKDVGNIANQVSAYLAYGDKHPYGEFATEETVNNITFDDVKTHYQRYFVPANGYLVIVGDVDYQEVKRLVTKEFSGWTSAKSFAKTIAKPQNVQYTQINFIDMPNAVQSELRLENTINLEMNDPDYFSALVANQILGGSFGSYLNMNLREQNGYTYGARSRVSADPYASRFLASTSVRNQVTDSAVVEAMKEIRRIRTEQVSQQDLSNTKNKYAGNFVLQLEDPSTIADFALNIERFNLPKDFYKNYLKNINAVTAEDVRKAALEYFKANQMRIVVAGKGQEVIDGLENIAINGKKVPVFYYDKKGKKIDKPNYDKALPDNASAATVFNNYLKAIGGRSNAENVKTLQLKATGSIQGTPLMLTVKQSKDGKFSQAVSVAGNVMSKEVYNGEVGYAMAQGQKIPYTEAQLAEAPKRAMPFPELMVNDAELVRLEPVNGSDAYVVKINDNTEVFYDALTGLKVKSVTTQSQGGQSLQITTTYSDYKQIEGLMFPAIITQSFGPQAIDFEAQEIIINPNFEASDFE